MGTVEAMGTGAQIVAAAALGGIMGGTRGYRAGRAVTARWEPILLTDTMLLADGQEMSAIEEPKRTRPRYLAGLFGLSIGVVPGVVLGLLGAWLVIAATPDPTGAERVFGLLVGGGLGLAAGLAIGLLLAIIADLLWQRRFEARLHWAVWNRRENLRSSVARGLVSPSEAIEQIQSDLAG